MNTTEWIKTILDANETYGNESPNDLKAFLLQPVPDPLWEQITDDKIREIVCNTYVHSLFNDVIKTPEEITEKVFSAGEVVRKLFYRKAETGETFGDVARIKEKYGHSLQETYGIGSGPFFDLAQTFWTYRIECNDLLTTPSRKFDEREARKYLYQTLLCVDNITAMIFFPTPGPFSIPRSVRFQTQKQAIRNNCPNIDARRFIKDSKRYGKY